MTPTRLYEILKETQIDFDVGKIEKYKRLDSGSIEFDLKSGNHGVFRIDPRTKKKYLVVEWR